MDKNIFNFIKTPQEDTHSVKRNTRFYLSIFKNNKIGEWFPSWNWACFFASFLGFDIVWLFYRRMYLNGILIGLVGVTFFEFIRIKLGLFLAAGLGLVIGKIVMWILKITWVFTFTVYGNSLYGKHINQQVEKGKTQSGTDPYTSTMIIILLCINLAYIIMKMMQAGITDVASIQDLMNQLMEKNAR